ncbi:MAG: hypothetical protein K8T91_17625 [Planctomycetes bacterium]|nr:hypothetical protein [Planctomycetota bacterium]
MSVPVSWVEKVGALRLPALADHRFQKWMDRNNEGQLSQSERAELESLVEISEQFSLVRAEALRVLGKSPA